MTQLEHQKHLIELYDEAALHLREQIVRLGAHPVAVALPNGHGVEGALSRRKKVNDTLCEQLINLATKGAPSHA